jgi:hypothetical protein
MTGAATSIKIIATWMFLFIFMLSASHLW